MKVCIACGIAKPLRDYYLVQRGLERRQSRCKACDNRRRCLAAKRGVSSGTVDAVRRADGTIDLVQRAP